MSNDNEKSFRIRPRRPHGERGDQLRSFSTGYKRLMHLVRMSRRSSARGGSPAHRTHTAGFQQRCAVRLTYASNRISGQWAAHGRYLVRESAAEGEVAFDSIKGRADTVKTLQSWQNARDPRLFKIIVSPEFGERLDLKSFTRELMARLQRDLGSLEWIAVAHYNTDHPHVHIALRGLSEGKGLRIPRQYVQSGIRAQAQDICTRELGDRTHQDALLAQRREIWEVRYTSLDRLIEASGAKDAAPAFLFTANPAIGQNHPVRARLKYLGEMGLVEDLGGDVWRVRSDFASILKSMQRAMDHQRMLAAHGNLLSDRRLPLRVAQLDRPISVEGRVLAHGLDDTTGRPYMLLESTQGHVLYIPHDAAIERVRHQGKLRPNAFMEIERQPSGRVTVNELGDAEALLSDRIYLLNTARKLMLRGKIAGPPTWGGWLGRWQAALRQETIALRLEVRHHSIELS